MTKEQLSKLRYIVKNINLIKSQIKDINDSLSNLKTISDTVKGSMPEYPYIQRTYTVQGVDIEQYEKLLLKLNSKQSKLTAELYELEYFLDGVEDERMSFILRSKYVLGKTNKEIAKELSYDTSMISKLINKYMKE